MFDTYAAAKALRNAGFDEPQAEAAVAMVRDAVSEGVATGEDAARLESKIDAGIAETKTDVTRLEGKVDAGLAETRADGARFESKVDARFAEVKAEIAEVKAEIAEVKGGLAKVKADVAEVKAGLTEVKTDVARLDGKIESEVGRLEARLTVRMYSGLIATAAVVVALIKLLP